MIEDNMILSLNKQIRMQWEATQDAYVLLYAEGMIKLNGTSAEILQLCNGKMTVKELIESLEKQYPEADIADDVKTFLGEAVENDWIH